MKANIRKQVKKEYPVQQVQAPKYKKVKQEAQESANNPNSSLIPIDANLKHTSSKLTKLISQKSQPADFNSQLDKIWAEINTPFLHKIAIKKIGSRLIQMLLKHSNKILQQKIVDRLLSSSQQITFEEVAKAKYGHFILKKIFKLKCCSKEQQAKIFTMLKKSIKSFIIIHEGSQVINSYLSHLATPNQLNQLKGIFTNTNPLEKDQIEEDLMNMTNKIITNATYTNALSVLIPVEKEQAISVMKEQIYNISLSKEGIKLSLQIINAASAKDRKLIVKSLKGKVMEMICFENVKSYLIILKLLTCIDDTVLLKNNIINEMKQNLGQLLTNKHGIILIENLLSSSQNAMKEFEKDLGESTSKKDNQQRKEEVVSLILPDIIAFIEQNLNEYLKTQQALIVQILQYIISENSSYIDFIKTIWNTFKQDCLDKLPSAKIKDQQLENQDSILVCNQNSHRILKFLVKMQSSILSNDKLDSLDDLYTELFEIVQTNFKSLIYGRSIFIIIALIENTNYSQQVCFVFLIEYFQKLKKLCQKNKEIQSLNFPGIKILQKLII